MSVLIAEDLQILTKSDFGANSPQVYEYLVYQSEKVEEENIQEFTQCLEVNLGALSLWP